MERSCHGPLLLAPFRPVCSRPRCHIWTQQRGPYGSHCRTGQSTQCDVHPTHGDGNVSGRRCSPLGHHPRPSRRLSLSSPALLKATGTATESTQRERVINPPSGLGIPWTESLPPQLLLPPPPRLSPQFPPPQSSEPSSPRHGDRRAHDPGARADRRRDPRHLPRATVSPLHPSPLPCATRLPDASMEQLPCALETCSLPLTWTLLRLYLFGPFPLDAADNRSASNTGTKGKSYVHSSIVASFNFISAVANPCRLFFLGIS
jgi:hypothetical protein